MGPLRGAVDQDHSRHSMSILHTSHVNPPLRPGRLPNVAHPPPQSPTVIISSNSQTPPARRPLEPRSVYKNTRPPSSATSARRNSLVPIIFDRISVPTPTNVHSSATSAPKHSPASTTGRDMRAFTAARRSLFVEASSAPAVPGAAAGDSLVPTPWADTSEAKPVESASSLCSTRKLWNASATWTSR